MPSFTVALDCCELLRQYCSLHRHNAVTNSALFLAFSAQGAAVVRSDGLVLGEALASQHALHEAFGGVVPSLARDAHAKNLDAVIAAALRQVTTKDDCARLGSPGLAM